MHRHEALQSARGAEALHCSIQYKRVVNLKGDLPAGYADGGAKTVSGLGATSATNVANLANDAADLTAARAASEEVAAILGALTTATDAGRKTTL